VAGRHAEDHKAVLLLTEHDGVGLRAAQEQQEQDADQRPCYGVSGPENVTETLGWCGQAILPLNASKAFSMLGSSVVASKRTNGQQPD
jgi:hypothetical protein